jgi:hypothetical protein
MNEKTGLVTINEDNLPEVFTVSGIDLLIKKIEEQVDKEVFDIDTVKGRKEIISLAAKVSKAKTAVESKRIELVKAEKQRLALIDKEGKRFRDKCDEIRDSVRAPVTEWEGVRKAVDTKMDEMRGLLRPDEPYTSESIAVVIAELESTDLETIVKDKRDDFEVCLLRTTKALNETLEDIKIDEAEKAELERFRAAEEERKRVEAEEAIKAEAAEAARREAEQEAENKRVAAEEQRQREINEAAARELALTNEKLQAEAAAEKAKNDALEQAAQAARDAEQAIKDAEVRALQAVEDEKQRVANEKAKEDAANAKREANKTHRKKINNAAKKCFVANGLSEDQAIEIITMIAQGKIDNITVNY